MKYVENHAVFYSGVFYTIMTTNSSDPNDFFQVNDSMDYGEKKKKKLIDLGGNSYYNDLNWILPLIR